MSTTALPSKSMSPSYEQEEFDAPPAYESLYENRFSPRIVPTIQYPYPPAYQGEASQHALHQASIPSPFSSIGSQLHFTPTSTSFYSSSSSSYYHRNPSTERNASQPPQPPQLRLNNTITPFQTPRERPIAIPATDSKLGSPFLRAFLPVLEDKYQLSREVFLRFLDDLNRAAVASPPIQALGFAGDIVGLVPLATAQIVGNSVSASAQLATYGVSKGRTEYLVRQANEDVFGPRGLKAQIAKLDKLARVANVPILKEGKIDKDAALLRPLNDSFECESLPGQRRRLESIQPWIAPLDMTPLPAIYTPDSMLSKLNAKASESHRKSGEKKMIKGRRKARDEFEKDTNEAREEFDKEMTKLDMEEIKVYEKYQNRPSELRKRQREIEREREKCTRKYEKEMEKAEKGKAKDDEEEKGMRKILWLLIRPVGVDDYHTGEASY